jgi:hypothetical protein
VTPQEEGFFFEKRSKITFANWAGPIRGRLSPDRQSFLVLFFKKEPLPPLPTVQTTQPARKNAPSIPQIRIAHLTMRLVIALSR